MQLNIEMEWLEFVRHIREIPDSSLGSGTGYSDGEISRPSSIL
jgi:hypothetical protein